MRESIKWFDVQLRDDESKLRPEPVRIYVMGSKRWMNLSEWPPSGIKLTRWNLIEGKLLDRKSPSADFPPDTYDFDPYNPTPSVGGVVLGAPAGPKDNRRLELRKDVLSYTSPTFGKEYTVIGPVSVELFLESSLENTDFFARLCDVSPDGNSRNICDGLIRLGPAEFSKYRGSDGVSRVTFDLWPTAYCFLKAHRIRLQVSSGSHPRYARNLGSGEPLATARNFKIANQKIFHDANHVSSVLLPEYEATN